jgi:hypothetical protein
LPTDGGRHEGQESADGAEFFAAERRPENLRLKMKIFFQNLPILVC